jgi:hypothetical protein
MVSATIFNVAGLIANAVGMMGEGCMIKSGLVRRIKEQNQ